MTEVDAIFDAVGKASSYVHLCHNIREKKEQIRNVQQKRCGNCDHWMKSSCKPEKEKKQFKSCNSFACGDFERDYFSKQLEAKFTEELERIVKGVSRVKWCSK